MTQTQSKRTYQVSYYIEAGFFLDVEARSKAHAERIVEKMLDEENDVLPGSERVHYDGRVCLVTTRLVKKGGAA